MLYINLGKKISQLEQLDHSLTNNFIQFTENFSGNFSFLLDIENEQTLKDTRISFLHKIFQRTLKTRYLHNANKCCLRLQLFVKFFISDMDTLL